MTITVEAYEMYRKLNGGGVDSSRGHTTYQLMGLWGVFDLVERFDEIGRWDVDFYLRERVYPRQQGLMVVTWFCRTECRWFSRVVSQWLAHGPWSLINSHSMIPIIICKQKPNSQAHGSQFVVYLDSYMVEISGEYRDKFLNEKKSTEKKETQMMRAHQRRNKTRWRRARRRSSKSEDLE